MYRTVVKYGGLALAGVGVGLAVVGMMRWQGTPTGDRSTKSGSISLSAVDTPSPTPDLIVRPAGPLQTGGADLAASAAAPTEAPADNVPSPDNFKQYEKYRDNPTALYGDLAAGQGKAIVMGSKVTVDYRGWLTDGTEFDESYARKQPFSFIEGEHKVIAGWEEALMGMKVGGKRRVIVPPSQGYGANSPAGIPANAVLIFDVELEDVQ